MSGTKTPSPLQKDIRSRLLQHSGSMASVDETLEEAAASAAYKIADAENKSFVAAEAVKEAERVTKMAEDVDLLLQLVEEIYDQCKFSYNIFTKKYSKINSLFLSLIFLCYFGSTLSGSRGKSVMFA